MSNLNQKLKQKGAVSLFVVVFATLLISIVTVSFTRIMVQHQQQANAADLSQSAYDSAKDGVEDGKRLLAYLQNACNTGSGDCADIKLLLNAVPATCNAALIKIGIVTDPTSKDVKIQSSGLPQNNLDQAYTCLKIALNTPDYLGELLADESKMIPLKATGAFNRVKIEWFSKKNLTASVNSGNPLLPSNGTPLPLPLLSRANWSVNTPPIMRTQFIQFDGSPSGPGFKLSDLDSSTGALSKTAFLYPTSSSSAVPIGLEGTRRDGTIDPDVASCQPLLTGVYSCTATVNMSNPLGGTAFLRLSAIYNNAQFRISLYNGGTLVQFDGVQPEIDSTGRANTLFRRVKSRVELSDTSFPYPDAAVDITGNFCKNFLITDMPSDYANSCTP